MAAILHLICAYYHAYLRPPLYTNHTLFTSGMEDDDNFPSLADFYFHTIGDKTVYSSTLDDLFVCYTLTRGMQLESLNPRRPALPLELILRITRFAGFMDVNPDPALTLDVTVPYTLPGTHGNLLFLSRKLSRTHLLSMARIHLIPSQIEKPHYVRAPRYCVSTKSLKIYPEP